ncbi:hypothetical protein CEXT_417661 [Caerostris extrusa]|uniref:Uncharacterized protein n=1 Tax=Caerostris extrusa TaxID=172846 RepID=A0AAV4MLJ6_CAEEX|nr:hypothetical protein CEXT_417661 [Caerostris extrusa]
MVGTDYYSAGAKSLKTCRPSMATQLITMADADDSPHRCTVHSWWRRYGLKSCGGEHSMNNRTSYLRNGITACSQDIPLQPSHPQH